MVDVPAGAVHSGWPSWARVDRFASTTELYPNGNTLFAGSDFFFPLARTVRSVPQQLPDPSLGLELAVLARGLFKPSFLGECLVRLWLLRYDHLSVDYFSDVLFYYFFPLCVARRLLM